ncbi:MAG: hypothetical protein WC335_09335 [Candidatus Omnitrophota bacterium]|jgi:tetratricopeptide (TPR) repeat protein
MESRTLILNRSRRFVIPILLFLVTSPVFVASAQSPDVSIERANQAKEDSLRALEQVEKAQETAHRAEIIAEKAFAESKNIADVSERIFGKVQMFLYIILGIFGIIQGVSLFSEFKRRRVEESRFQDIFDKQIESLGKLGQVIDTVKQAFSIQIKESEAKEEYLKKAKELEETLKGYFKDYMGQFDRIDMEIESFKKLSRLEWVSISDEQRNLAKSARASFDTIPKSVFSKIDDQSRLGEMSYQLGVSAFYDNDIIAASDLLERAKAVYDKLGESIRTTRHRNPYAFCHHFLGLIEKNWCRNGMTIEASLEKAKEYLKRATEILGQDPMELLSPLTLAEIQSYLAHNREDAYSLIQDCIKKTDDLKNTGKKLNPNQQNLLVRAYLLKGNLEYIKTNYETSKNSYVSALNEKPGNFYALFSQGLVSLKLKPSDAKILFRESLNSFRGSNLLNKPELTTRGTILAQAVIAAHYSDDSKKDDYLNLFRNLLNRTLQVGDRNPLFFSPTTKKLVTAEQLRNEVVEECKITI